MLAGPVPQAKNPHNLAHSAAAAAIDCPRPKRAFIFMEAGSAIENIGPLYLKKKDREFPDRMTGPLQRQNLLLET